MARPLEPITAAKALEALADNSRSHHPAERLIIPVIPRDSTMGPIPHVEAQALMRGIGNGIGINPRPHRGLGREDVGDAGVIARHVHPLAPPHRPTNRC